MLRINEIQIHGVGPIRDLTISLNPHFNIICGANGIGKTTILNCIAQSFTYNSWTVRKNASCEKGNWTLQYVHDVVQERRNEDGTTKKEKEIIRKSFFHEITSTYLYEPERNGIGIYQEAPNVILFNVNRLFNYINVDKISKDPIISDVDFGSKTVLGQDPNHIKSWFVNRYLWSAQPGVLPSAQIANLEIAISCFKWVNSNYHFQRVDHMSNDIIISTPHGDIELEQLSAGYISMVTVLMGIINEIEYRNRENPISVSDYEGVVIIDELDVHLHPSMQTAMYFALNNLLPKAQIITSTHSPHIIQVAKPSEIIPLVIDGKETIVNPLINKEYGCQGWSVEEILSDVMGMQSIRTNEYEELIYNFGKAVDASDGKAAKACFAKLEQMLHPNSYLKEVLKVQMIGLDYD
jgi:predicted ATP-binding protein involved in virulence